MHGYVVINDLMYDVLDWCIGPMLPHTQNLRLEIIGEVLLRAGKGNFRAKVKWEKLKIWAEVWREI